MIIISVVTIMSLLTSILMFNLETGDLAKRLSANRKFHEQLMQVAEVGLSDAFQQLPMNLFKCHANLHSSDYWLSQPIKWWNSSQTCHGNFGDWKYEFVFTPLQNNHQTTYGKSLKQQYYQITLRAYQHFLTGTIVQETVAVTHAPFSNPVRLSWRQL